MDLRQPRTSCNTGLPIRRPSPARTLKHNRCFECHLGTPPDNQHATCLHQNEFSPTPNRFSILATLSPRPESECAFDFLPTSRSSTKRRGKRGGKQRRLKHALKKTREELKADGLDKLCDRLTALCLDDNTPQAILQTSDHEARHSTTSGCSTSSLDAIRHHWAPQFRPNTLPTSKPIIAEPANVQLTSLPSKLAQGSSVEDSPIDVLPSTRTINPRFPLPAFLGDIASPADCAGYWPPRTSVPELAPPPQTAEQSYPSTAALSVTAAQSTAAAAARCALVMHQNIMTPSSNAARTRRAVPTTSSLSDNTVFNDERSPAFGISPFTRSTLSVHTSSPTLAIPPAPGTESAMPAFPQSKSFLSDTLTAVPIPSRPVTTSMSPPPLPMLQQSSTTSLSRPPAPQRSPCRWQKVSEGITVFHSPPLELITAPVTSPYPFVYPPCLWRPTTVSKDLFKNTATMPSMLRRKLSLSPPSPRTQKELEAFLDMGHAHDCWCSSSKHPDQKYGMITTDTATEELRAEIAITDRMSSLRALDSDVPPSITQAPCTFAYSSDVIDSKSPDSDIVLISPYSEGSNSAFEELGITGGQPVDSDDEEWIAISPRLRPIASWTVSDASVQTSNAALVVASLPAALPSPPQTPLTSAYQAQASDTESETEQGDFRSWNESPVQSVQSIKEEMWDLKVQPGVVYTSAVESSTLRESIKTNATRKEPSVSYDGGWGGKVWDGVTDWFT